MNACPFREPSPPENTRMMPSLHLIGAVAALLTGTATLARPKGDALHRVLGRIYGASMALVVATSFTIYELYQGAGPFHALAMVSGLTLVAGLLPVCLRRPATGWHRMHLAFMYWSVIGLYAAAVAEVLVRLDGVRMGPGVGVAVAGVFAVAAVPFARRRRAWTQLAVGAAPSTGVAKPGGLRPDGVERRPQ